MWIIFYLKSFSYTHLDDFQQMLAIQTGIHYLIYYVSQLSNSV